MKHLYPNNTFKTGLLALAVTIITYSAQAQCPSGSTSNTAGTYTNGQTVCISTSFSGMIKLNNGAKMVVVNGGNFTGDIDANNGSKVEVRTGGTFNPGNANNFAATVTSEKNSTINLARSGFGIASGFSLTNYGNLTWAGNWNQNATVTVTNTACGTMTFAQGTGLANSATIVNDGMMYFKGDLTTNSGTTINNRGRITVSGNFNPSGALMNQWQFLAKSGVNFNGNDSIVNLYTFVIGGSASGSPRMRNEGLAWIGGSFNYNGNTIRNNRSNAQLRIGGALSNNGTISGIGSVYVSGGINNNGTFTGVSSSQLLTVNQTISNGTRTYLNVSSSLVAVDTTTFTGGAGNPSTTCAVLLPMTLTALKAVYADEAINLTWSTVSEINSKQFEVEYSTDGTNWTTAGIVAAKGSSSVKVDYSYKFTRIAGTSNYFRLKMEDQDGSAEYSTTVLIKIAATQQISASVYPNPFAEKLEITVVLQKSNTVQVKLYDMSGRVAKAQTFNAQAGGSKLMMTGLNNLNKGMYVVEITAGTERWMQKIIK